MRQPTWTRCERGWSVGPYRIETIAPDLSVLSLDGAHGPRVVTTAASTTELEAFQAIHARAMGKLRPVILGLIYVLALAGMVTGSLIGKTAGAVCVGAAALLTVGSVVSMSQYVLLRRVVRNRVPV